MFDQPSYDHHQEVILASDPETDLRLIIAIHNLSRGPALGGCRVWSYDRYEDALADALRLSRGMTYKAAMADLPLGGGKAVMLVREPGTKTPGMFDALGRVVEDLAGRFIVAEDVGSSPCDMLRVRAHTRHVAGIDPAHGGGGDPSPATAYGCFIGVQAAAKAALKRKDLKGVHVSLQGLGNVGFALARHLSEAGAKLTVTDIDAGAVHRAETELGATGVGLQEIFDVDADIFSPNALGGILSAQTIPRLKASAIAGGANNQLATSDDGFALQRRGILYAPDYVVNAGGLTNACGEYFGWAKREVDLRIEGIADRLTEIFSRAESGGEPPHIVADTMAEQLFGRRSLAAAA